MREPPNGWHGRKVERVARVLRESANTALAEDHVVVAFAHDVLGGEQPFVERGGESALQEHGQARATGAFKQSEVLHVARAELDHVAVAFHEIDAVLVERLSYDLQTVSLAHVCENLQALFAETLKGIRRSARLKRTAAKEAHARTTHRLGHSERLCATLNRTGAGDDGQLFAADGRIADAHDGLFGFQIERDQFVGLAHADRFGDAGQILEVARIDRALIAGDADGCALLAGHRMRAKAQVLNDAHHIRDLAFGRIRFHNDKHKKFPVLSFRFSVFRLTNATEAETVARILIYISAAMKV